MNEVPPPPRRLIARLRLAGPDEVLRWSSGEVTRPDTLHPRSGKPVPGGLFCEAIFGPLVEWRCRCGQVAGEKALQRLCRRCNTPVLRRRGGRRCMGHIDLAVPVAHPWFVKARPSPLALLLDLEPGVVQRIVYGECLLPAEVGFSAGTGAAALEERLRALDLEALAADLRGRLVDAGSADSARRQHLLQRLRLTQTLLDSKVRPEWMILRRLSVVGPALRPVVRLGSGRHASSELNDLYRRVISRNNRLRELLSRPTPASILHSEQRLLQVAVDALLDNRRCAQPVLGPRQRPLRSLSDQLGGKQGLFRGNLLGKRVDYSARSVIVVGPELKLHEVGLPRPIALQLFEPLLLGQLQREGWASTLRRGRQLLHELAHPELLVELARAIVRELVRRRQVEHARSVVDRCKDDPDAGHTLLELDTAEARWRGRVALADLSSVAVESVRQRLASAGRAEARRWAHRLLLARQDDLWDLVRRVISGHPVLLNRAPTLHRMGVQAFEPVLVVGNAIRLHPLVCRAFNADFDGDQMAVHLPLSREAIAEARERMAPASNLFNPASAQPIITPTQDIVLGCYYLTVLLQPPGSHPLETSRDGPPPPVPFDPPVTDHGGGRAFAGIDEVRLAHDLGRLGTQARIRLRLPGGHVVEEDDELRALRPGQVIDTSAGRALFNSLLPAGLAYYNLTLTAKRLARVLADCHRKLGRAAAVDLLDRLKEAGFAAATRSGASFACDDVPRPRAKPTVLRDTLQRVEVLRHGFDQGNLDADEYRAALLEAWDLAHKRLTEKLLPDLRQDTRNGRAYLNPLYLMADSGARGSPEQIRQLAGLRGLMASVSGRVIERPITASLREGLPSWDYFVSASGSRKGLTDKGVRTAEAGYLTRKLVDALQAVVVTLADCGTPLGVLKRAPLGTLAARVSGRVCQEQVLDDSGEEVIAPDEVISPGQARQLAELGRTTLRVRSPLTCQAEHGVCQRCYGTDLSTGKLVEVGTAVGVIAAQSIGEPGTQLTLRTFQLGGVAGKDIVNDLDRVTRLLEVSPVADPVPLAPRPGVVHVFSCEPTDIPAEAPGWWLDDTGHDDLTRLGGRELRVRHGEGIPAGTPLTEGEVDLRRMLLLGGPELVGDHLLEQVRRIYRQHRLDIDDRHFEVVLSRMLGSVVVRDPGDTGLLAGTLLSRTAFRSLNRGLPPGRKPATARVWLLGVSQVAARAEGFLAAASFQHAVRVLAEAALAARVDHLLGPKENTLLGLRIPAGTGHRACRFAPAPRPETP